MFLADSNLIGKRLQKYPVINSNVKLVIWKNEVNTSSVLLPSTKLAHLLHQILQTCI